MRNKRDIFNFQMFGSGEEGYVIWEIINRIGEYIFFKDQVVKFFFMCCDCIIEFGWLIVNDN